MLPGKYGYNYYNSKRYYGNEQHEDPVKIKNIYDINISINSWKLEFLYIKYMHNKKWFKGECTQLSKSVCEQ